MIKGGEHQQKRASRLWVRNNDASLSHHSREMGALILEDGLFQMRNFEHNSNKLFQTSFATPTETVINLHTEVLFTTNTMSLGP